MHLDSCIDLDKKSFKGIWTKSQWLRELSDPGRICLGAIKIDTKKLIGFCSGWIVLNELQVTLVAVHPLHLRKGIGKLLMKDLIKQSKLKLINQIYLEVKEKNEPAKALYKSMGFKIKGHRFNFYKDGSNALIYSKILI